MIKNFYRHAWSFKARASHWHDRHWHWTCTVAAVIFSIDRRIVYCRQMSRYIALDTYATTQLHFFTNWNRLMITHLPTDRSHSAETPRKIIRHITGIEFALPANLQAPKLFALIAPVWCPPDGAFGWTDVIVRKCQQILSILLIILH